MEGLGARFVPVMRLMNKLKELREICKEMHEIEEATERVEVNSRFHTMIAHYSGNERVVEYLASFRERVNRVHVH